MKRECSVDNRMRNAGTIELFHYWNRIRDGKPAPLRTQIEPVDIRTYLADTFILEQGLSPGNHVPPGWNACLCHLWT